MTQGNQLPLRNLHDQCKNYMHHHVLLTGADGSSFDGIIVDVDMNGVTVLVGEDVMERDGEQHNRQFGDYGYDDDYDYDGYYGRPRRRYRRYRPHRFPLGSLAALALLPYVFPRPYYPPYNPYYPPYPYY